MSNALNHHRYACKSQPTAPVCRVAGVGQCPAQLFQRLTAPSKHFVMRLGDDEAGRVDQQVGQQHLLRVQPALAVRLADLGKKREKGDSPHGLWSFKHFQPHQCFTDAAAGHRVSARLGQRLAPRTTLLEKGR